jgi:superfamily II DNA or RNA helicase/diadenosine tetraphosphate (Ap4A) HIT family hydrolase/HKD family nuclease
MNRSRDSRDHQPDCPFCNPDMSRVFYEGQLTLGLWDGYPVTPGHALLVPRRHVADWFSASAAEKVELFDAIEATREAICREHDPQGFNLGVNVGRAAGQTVFHLHVHVIPRYDGDVADPTGGVRGVIPHLANYRRPGTDAGDGARQPQRGPQAHHPHHAREALSPYGGRGPTSHGHPNGAFDSGRGASPFDGGGKARPAAIGKDQLHVRTLEVDLAPLALPRLVRGERDDPLLRELSRAFDRAVAVDIAVAFVKASGVAALREHLVELCAPPQLGGRGGRLRLLCGDYLELTDPMALRALCDLPGDVELRVFESQSGPGFHPKAWIFHFGAESYLGEDGGVAYVGSSNLSAAALGDAVEWSYRVVSAAESGAGFAAVQQAFEQLFTHTATRPLDLPWIDRYEARREARLEAQADGSALTGQTTEPDLLRDTNPSLVSQVSALELEEALTGPRWTPDVRPSPMAEVDVAPEPRELPTPHVIQREALAALEATRQSREVGERDGEGDDARTLCGNGAGLVVLATGLGKTWLSAFDSNRPEYARVLFVAHREEILDQAMATYRAIRPTSRFGRYTGQEKSSEGAEVLFASIQTLSRPTHLEGFAAEAFDYIVIDEFHHAHAASYRRLIEHFSPRFLLGLTATPERTDGGDLLTLTDGNVVYRADLGRGIAEGLLSPFSYYGVADDLDYQQIPWRSTRFDDEALTRALATRKRAANALEQWRRLAPEGRRALVFCCSQRHADFMASYLRGNDVPAVAVHAGESSAPRATSLDRLADGELCAICCVDIFNEGVDIPDLDTVIMLRPTESPIVWLQQLGRGLRYREGKTLTVIDYIGNHRTFLVKPRTLFEALGGEPGGFDLRALAALRESGGALGLEALPAGCAVTYDLELVEVLEKLVDKQTKAAERIKAFYDDYRERHGRRPRAAQVFRAGYNPRALRKSHGSWLEFVAAQEGGGALDDYELQVLERAVGFLRELETTAMTKSYKMVLLSALLEEQQNRGSHEVFPGQLEIAPLVDAFARRAARSAKLLADLSVPAADREALKTKLVKYPIDAWCKTGYFSFADDVLSTVGLPTDPELRPALCALTAELVEWRLAAYLDRALNGQRCFEIKVDHNRSGDPILAPLQRAKRPGLPSGWTPVTIDGAPHHAKLVKEAINVVLAPDRGEANVLPEILRRWFGEDAGASGTRQAVLLSEDGDGWRLEPREQTRDVQ